MTPTQTTNDKVPLHREQLNGSGGFGYVPPQIHVPSEPQPLFAKVEVDRNRPVACLTLTGKVLHIYAHTLDAAREINKQVPSVPIMRARSAIYACNGRNRSYMGYKWRYADNVCFTEPKQAINVSGT